MARAISIVVNVVDAKGKASKTRIFAPTTMTVAEVQTWGIAVAGWIADLSACRVTRVSVCVPIDITVGNTLKTVANALADVGQKALFVWNSVLAGFKLKFNMPAFDESKITANSDVVYQADTAVSAFVTAIETGFSTTNDGTVYIANSRGNSVDVLDYAVEKFRNI